MSDKPEDLLAFITRGEVVCDECGEDLGRGARHGAADQAGDPPAA